jgi:hypothetical protein
MSLPPATIKSVLVNDFADANEEVAPLDLDTEEYYPCCGKSACGGCIHSICKFDNEHKCPFCNSHRGDKTDEEMVKEIKKRVEANDPVSICLLAYCYQHGTNGFQQDCTRAIEPTLEQQSLVVVRCMLSG